MTGHQAGLSAYQLQELRHLATFAGGKHVWVNSETITQLQLVELGLVNQARIGPLAGGRYKWRFSVSADGRELLSATATVAAGADSASDCSSREASDKGAH